MALRGLRYPDIFTFKPSNDLLPRLDRRFGTFEHAGIGHQADKCEQAWPWEPYRSRTIELLVQPLSRWRVLRERRNVGVD
jgi:hypothetical protein